MKEKPQTERIESFFVSSSLHEAMKRKSTSVVMKLSPGLPRATTQTIRLIQHDSLHSLHARLYYISPTNRARSQTCKPRSLIESCIETLHAFSSFIVSCPPSNAGVALLLLLPITCLLILKTKCCEHGKYVCLG